MEEEKDTDILTIRVHPGNLIFHVKRGTPLREFLLKEGILMDFPCGGKGTCGQCRVLIDPAPDTGRGESLSREDIQRGMRLACQTVLVDSCSVTIPEGGETGGLWQDAATLEETHMVAGEALVRRHRLTVPEPSLQDQRSDWDRVRDVLAERGFQTDGPDYSSMEQLSANLRAGDWTIHVLLEDGVFIRSCLDYTRRVYGFAVDLGTTTVDVSLHEMETGRRIGRKTLLNRQTAFGADVISRAQAFEEDRNAVRSAALETIQEAAFLILKESGIEPDRIVRSVVVGNPIMLHIFHDLRPFQLTLSPYIPVVSGIARRRPCDFGWSFQKHGFVETLPIISAFVGADTTGMILALDLVESEGVTVSIDIGTNGEVVLSKDGKLYATSAAAGPAFEGAQIACGARAVPGTICELGITEDGVSYGVLGDEGAGGRQPTGICGTGLIKAVAQLLDTGVLDETGRFLEPEELDNPVLRSRLFERDGMRAFAVTEDRGVFITQKDVREIQLAKGAIRTAIDSLLEAVDVSWEQIDLIRLAGNFGAGMDGEAEMRIGLFPPIDRDRIDVVGNAALRGAALALVSKTVREKGAAVPGLCSFLELAGTPSFQMRFSESMLFTQG